FFVIIMIYVYHNRRVKTGLAEPLNAENVGLEELLQQSDFVVTAVDLNAESKALMGKAQFELMQKHAIFINIARGSVVDEQALIEALQNEVIFAAGLDVYEKEPLQESALFTLPNVVTLPHVGSATAETRKKMANLAYKNLVEAL
ncbi:NAD(P)-dependent oxidoreductase, partial [Acinetobacter baumannii]|uniref:NAD(P)-dependent oxidoreductase n=1 Tax=Acinetobacter baumannii TaxID=470 RepID=UPI001C5C52CE|nr:bifunctional glyoxylate/hydroxypyruvate reductase B [Acinetobacter baumannii]